MKNDFDVFSQFCTYLEDWKNWYDGEVDGERVKFYSKEPNFRVLIEYEDKSDKEQVRIDLDRLNIKSNSNDATDAKYFNIHLLYNNLKIINNLRGISLDNGRVEIAIPLYDSIKNKSWYNVRHTRDGLAYYTSLMLGGGKIARNRDGDLLEFETNHIAWGGQGLVIN